MQKRFVNGSPSSQDWINIKHEDSKHDYSTAERPEADYTEDFDNVVDETVIQEGWIAADIPQLTNNALDDGSAIICSSDN